MSYFSDLVIDSTQEKPEIAGDLEAGRRLLFMLKEALNGNAMILSDKSEDPGNQIVSVSPEWIDLFGWTADDINTDADQVFHPDDLDMVAEIGEYDLAGPYAVRLVKKGQNYHSAKWYKIVALTVLIDDRHFRCWTIEETS